MSEPEANKPSTATSPGPIIALGAAGVLLVVLFFRSSPRTDLPIDQRQMSAALVQTMMTNGVLVNYDCGASTAWVNRAVWNKYNPEQKRNMTLALATECNSQHAGYRIAIVDYDSRATIAGFDGKTLTLDQ